jgi:predicted acyl esterase
MTIGGTAPFAKITGRYNALCSPWAAGRMGYTNTIPRLLERLQTPSKGLIGPWVHGYPHIARPGPQIGFLQQALRWWDHWLKGEGNGVKDEPMLRAWISANVAPAADHVELPGRWVAEDRWPPVESVSGDLLLWNDGLQAVAVPLTAIDLRTSETVATYRGRNTVSTKPATSLRLHQRPSAVSVRPMRSRTVSSESPNLPAGLAWLSLARRT